MSDLDKARAILARLKIRGLCFDLMLAFCDRATVEDKLDQATAALEAAAMIHRGDNPGGAFTSDQQ